MSEIFTCGYSFMTIFTQTLYLLLLVICFSLVNQLWL